MQFLGEGQGPGTPQGQMPPGPMPTSRQPDVQYVKDWYIYEFSTLASAPSGIAPGGSLLGNIQIDADSDFELTKLAMAANTNASDTPIVPAETFLNLLIVDSGSGRQLFSNPVPVSALFGSGELPSILPVPRRFSARSNIALTITNYSQGLTYDAYFSFMGAKVFSQGK
jgi:hypothetical protein